MKSNFPGLCLYTVRHAVVKDLKDTLQLLAAVGYRELELYRLPFSYSPSDLASAMSSSELTPVSWHLSWSDVHTPKLCQILQDCGCSTVVTSSLFDENESITREAWLSRIDEFNHLFEAFAASGVRLGIHTSQFCLRPCEDGQTYLQLLLERISPDVLIELDTGNCYQQNQDPCHIIRQCASHPLYIHMKPYSPTKGFDVVLGEKEDISDWSVILKAGTEATVEKWLIEGSCSSLHEVQVACLSLHNWKRFMVRG